MLRKVGRSAMEIKWSDWKMLGKPAEAEIRRPVVHSNQDGRLEVFVGGSGGIFGIWQVVPNGAWSDRWRNHGRPERAAIRSHIVGNNADGRLEIFGVGE